MDQLIAIVGPTGSGKTRLAIHLAQKFSGEIVNADSRQVYRYMDIGTAKPAPQQLSTVPHHLIGIVNPDEEFSLAQYQELAYRTIKDIQKRGKLPFLVGGTGQYVRAVLEGWQVPRVPPNPTLRHELEQKATASGAAGLYAELVKVDPVAAQKIDPRNIRRVIRALEVQSQAQTPFSKLQTRKAPPFNALIIGLTMDRKELYRRIDSRVDEMIRNGLVAEVEKLVKMGYDFNLSAMSSIGYKQIGMALRGELTLDGAIAQSKAETHRFVRHQYAWFRLKDEKIHWFDLLKEDTSAIEKLVADFMHGLMPEKLESEQR